MVEVPLQTVLQQTLGDASEGSSCSATPSGAGPEAASASTMQPSVFDGRCYFSRAIFRSVPCLCGGASNLPRCCDNRWDSSFKTRTNLPKCGCLPSSLHRRYVQRLRPGSKPTDLKAMLITVVLLFRYKTPKSWKQFWVVLQTWKRAKAHEEVP